MARKRANEGVTHWEHCVRHASSPRFATSKEGGVFSCILSLVVRVRIMIRGGAGQAAGNGEIVARAKGWAPGGVSVNGKGCIDEGRELEPFCAEGEQERRRVGRIARARPPTHPSEPPTDPAVASHDDCNSRTVAVAPTVENSRTAIAVFHGAVAGRLVWGK